MTEHEKLLNELDELLNEIHNDGSACATNYEWGGGLKDNRKELKEEVVRLFTQAHTAWKAEVCQSISELRQDEDRNRGITTNSSLTYYNRAIDEVLNLPSLQETEEEKAR